MPVYTTFVDNPVLELSLRPPADADEGFCLEIHLKRSLLPFVFLPRPRTREEVLSEILGATTGEDAEEKVSVVCLRDPRIALRFVTLLEHHHFLRPTDRIALHDTIRAWESQTAEIPA